MLGNFSDTRYRLCGRCEAPARWAVLQRQEEGARPALGYLCFDCARADGREARAAAAARGLDRIEGIYVVTLDNGHWYFLESQFDPSPFVMWHASAMDFADATDCGLLRAEEDNRKKLDEALHLT